MKKLPLVASGQEDKVHLDVIPDLDEQLDQVINAERGCVGAAAVATLGMDLNERTMALYAKVSVVEHHLVEIQNTQQEYHHSINRRLGLLEKNTWYMALQPAHHVQPAAAATAEENVEEEGDRPPFVASLSRCPHDLHILWQEYEFGICGWKPAKKFTPAKRGKVKVVYAKCKLVWDTIAGM
eukprot:13221961-Ditylum_brightwellii.AAC.1